MDQRQGGYARQLYAWPVKPRSMSAAAALPLRSLLLPFFKQARHRRMAFLRDASRLKDGERSTHQDEHVEHETRVVYIP